MLDGAATFAAGGEAYDRFVGRYGPELAGRLIDFAGVRAPARALDVGCGPGPLTRALADVLGEECVAAVDPSTPFVEACRARVPGADVRVGTAEHLPHFGHAFDAVLAQLVVNFLSDPVAGVGAMRAAVGPAGVVAAAVWDYGGGMTMLRTYWDAARSVDPAAPDEGRMMRFSTPDELAGLWATAGLAEIETAALDVAAAYADFDDYWTPFLAGIGPAGAHCVALDEERREAVRRACFDALGCPSGAFELTARAWAVRGRRR